jgi:hypothetical protein
MSFFFVLGGRGGGGQFGGRGGYDYAPNPWAGGQPGSQGYNRGANSGNGGSARHYYH